MTCVVGTDKSLVNLCMGKKQVTYDPPGAHAALLHRGAAEVNVRDPFIWSGLGVGIVCYAHSDSASLAKLLRFHDSTLR